jgi:hypothetical protein
MVKIRFIWLVAAVFAAAGLGLPGMARAAHCPAFPRVVWWGQLSHDTATKDVHRRYGGDWKSAIASWQRTLAKLTAIQKKGTTAVIRYTSTVPGLPAQTRRVKLRGPRLDDYIDNVWRRLAVMHCLADL